MVAQLVQWNFARKGVVQEIKNESCGFTSVADELRPWLVRLPYLADQASRLSELPLLSFKYYQIKKLRDYNYGEGSPTSM